MQDKELLEIIKDSIKKKDDLLSSFATKNRDTIRLKDINEDIRFPFFRDADSIIHSLAYTRYIDKTQVFTNPGNDNVSKRALHVQLVSKIARTIGRALELNEDLIEAIALGHDIGHTPFGHTGEAILNEISLKHNEGYFMHNVQSVRTLLYMEHLGEGLNISVQVLDGILCHNGEVLSGVYAPVAKTKEMFLKEYNDCYKDSKVSLKLAPMTLEGCVVRISDVIAYIGRDLEDGIRMGLISKENVPETVRKVLGDTNGSIVETIVTDIIKNSYGHNYIKMSKDVYEALEVLKNFNYKYIYYKATTKEQINNYSKMFNELFDFYVNAINNNIDCDIFYNYLNDMSKDYIDNNTINRKVIDYIAGMTDNYFFKQYNNNILKTNKVLK